MADDKEKEFMYAIYRSGSGNPNLGCALQGRTFTTSEDITGDLKVLCLSNDFSALQVLFLKSPRGSLDIHANEALRVLIEYLGVKRDTTGGLYIRCANLIRVLKGECRLQHSKMFSIMISDVKGSLPLRAAVIDEMRRRVIAATNKDVAQSIRAAADRYLYLLLVYSRGIPCHLLRDFLILHQDMIGDLTSAKLLQASVWFTWEEYLFPGSIQKITEYSSSHLSEYLYAIIYQMTEPIDSSQIRALLNIQTPVTEHIKLDVNGVSLFLGKRKFPDATRTNWLFESPNNESLASICRDITLYEERQASVATCSTCGECLTPDIFVDSRSPFGVYLCSKCAEVLMPSDTITRVICPVCMVEERGDIRMVVLEQCNHTCCDTCLAKMVVASSSQDIDCPICRTPVESKGTIPIPAITAVARFLKEMQY